MRTEPIQTATALSPHESKPPAGKRGLKQRVVEEVIKFWIAAFYLWVMFGTFALHEAVVSDKRHIDYHFYGLAIVNALILGKVMLVAEDLRFADWLKDRPLIYPILCKAISFSILFLVFYVVEEAIVGVIKGETVGESIPTIGGGSPRGVLFVGIILSIALIPFFAFREIGRVIGERELRALLFHKREPNRSLPEISSGSTPAAAPR